jgi:hypothetical protein
MVIALLSASCASSRRPVWPSAAASRRLRAALAALSFSWRGAGETLALNARLPMLQAAAKEGAMFDTELVDSADRHPDGPLATGTLPWRGVALLLGLTMLSIVAAILYPDVFGAPMEQF